MAQVRVRHEVPLTPRALALGPTHARAIRHTPLQMNNLIRAALVDSTK